MVQTAPALESAKRIAGDNSLLATKFFACRSRLNPVSRPRLMALLDAGRSAGLILVSAPAGFGKTTLLVEWLGQAPQGTCWLSLDAGDNHPTRFLSYVIAALQNAVPGLGADLLLSLRSAEPPPAEAILAALVNEIALAPHDVTLVLDDYHAITSPAVNAAITFLLENMPPNLHLVISSRADPAIPIARLRAHGRVVEVRTDALRFTQDEAAAFLRNSMGLALSAEQSAALGERAEGWIAGLQMAALSMQGRGDIAVDVDGFIRAFAGTNRYILDFLVEEVLSREPEPVQRFLLRTSILTRLSGPLCDAVLASDDAGMVEPGASSGILEYLDRANLFIVPLDDHRGWYRYHHLFADLLQARLHAEGRRRVSGLLERAADWCERAGQIAEAVAYVLAAQDYSRAAAMTVKYWEPMARTGEIETVWSWLAEMPEEAVRSSAALSVVYCWVLWLRGQVGAIEPHLVDAERALAGAVPPESGNALDDAERALPALVATLRSFVARYAQDAAAACAYAEQAVSLIPRDLPPEEVARLSIVTFLALASAYDGLGDLPRAVAAYTECIHCSRVCKSATGVAVTFRLISVLRLLGRLHAAAEACRDGLRYLDEQGMANMPAAGVLHLAMAEVLIERDELEAAGRHLAQGDKLGRRSGRFDAVKNAAPALVRLRLAQDDVDGALAAVAEAESALGARPPALARAELLALRARIYCRQGCVAEAARSIDEALQLAGNDLGLTGQTVALAAVRVQIAHSAPGNALAHLTRALAAAEAGGLIGPALELRILRSLALARANDMARAEADLEHALAVAEPEGYVRIFVEEGRPLAQILARLAARAGVAAIACSAGYVARLMAAFRAPAPQSSHTEDRRPVSVARVSEAPAHAPDRLGGEQPPLIEPLSDRELEVLNAMAEGLTNEQIAARLIIAVGTVKAHIHNISGKLAAHNRAHAVARAKELGLL